MERQAFNFALRMGTMIFLTVLQEVVIAAPPHRNTESLFQALKSHGISPEVIQGIDPDGVPMICGTCVADSRKADIFDLNLAKPPKQTNPPPTVLPAGARSWESIPGVIRNNGVDSFRLEVDVNGAVSGVFFELTAAILSFVSGPVTQDFRDDGLNGDRVAGDRIFTSEGIRYNGVHPISSHFLGHSSSPAGLHLQQFGRLFIVETNGVTNRFLITPGIGLLNTNVPLVETYQMASNIVISPHLVNIVTGTRQTQKSLRGSFSPLNGLTVPIYSVLPDAFDFFIFFSMDHMEYFPYSAYAANFILGAHQTVQVNYTGTGMGALNQSAYFGSGGRLLGLNVLDTTTRGVHDGNCTHELLHQWAAFTSTSLELSQGNGHFTSASSANSLLGGSRWTAETNGTYTTTCNDTLGGTTEAPPLDKYMMGLIPGSAVPPMFVATGASCYSTVTSGVRVVTISDIQAVHGVRTPTPETAQKEFNLLFVAESFGRTLTPVEMTYYDVLAGHYTKPIPDGEPSPLVPRGWSPISRYFGEGSKWSSDVLDVIRPKITATERLTNGAVRISGAGYPGRNYRLLKSTNHFTGWSAVANNVAGTNETFLLIDESTSSAPRYYRVATP